MWRCALVALAGCRGLLGFEEAVLVEPPTDGSPDTGDSSMIDTLTDTPVDAAEQEVFLIAVADTWLNPGQPNQPNGADPELFVDGGPVQTVLVRFDLTGIPPSATVTLAELIITTSTDTGNDCTVHVMAESWSETQATQNERQAGQSWLTAGAQPPSRAATSLGTIAVNVPNTTFRTALDLTAIKDWVATPASNFGVALATGSGNGARILARDNAVVASRPTLRVRFFP